MGKKRFKIAEFSALIGASQKTVYNMAKTGEIITEIEIQRGRKITFVISDDGQIAELQKRYGKGTSMKLHYYENVTQFTENENTNSENEIQNQTTFAKETDLQNRDSEIIKTVIEFSKTYNENLLTYNEKILHLQEQLLNEKARIPLLEDRQGLYLNEINELKKTKKHQQRLFIAVSLTLFILLVISVGTIIFLSLNVKQQAETKPPAVEYNVEH